MGARGPKAWMPSDEDVAKIKLYSGLGSTQEHVAAMIGKSLDTLWKHEACREAFSLGKAETIAKVAGTLVRKALSGDTASAIFYLKTQAGWKETNVHEHTGAVRQVHDLSKLSDEQLDALERLVTATVAIPDMDGESPPISAGVH